MSIRVVIIRAFVAPRCLALNYIYPWQLLGQASREHSNWHPQARASGIFGRSRRLALGRFPSEEREKPFVAREPQMRGIRGTRREWRPILGATVGGQTSRTHSYMQAVVH
ncbi:uncharacterized protein LY79DRAFT_548170 [Colletotrichum navitas]|uniref:Uncharacterized protein n=1 Tax=Colletotrichum navitas TaxID=681940 RepID=A0AAD8V862_9PEZI|nr:uncharacterized protein LY79DRAFT_548170 [Colletotrichum navitas]KAK1595130.1 hypothetical protein LY79DRAFT_548170 [Colletotrichum navitas]